MLVTICELSARLSVEKIDWRKEKTDNYIHGFGISSSSTRRKQTTLFSAPTEKELLTREGSFSSGEEKRRRQISFTERGWHKPCKGTRQKTRVELLSVTREFFCNSHAGY